MKNKILQYAVVLLTVGLLTGCTTGQGTISESSGINEESSAQEGRDEVTSGEQEQNAESTGSWEDKMSALISNSKEGMLSDLYGDYRVEGGEIAFVCDSAVMDGSYNEAIFDGIQTYALAAGVSFSYYVVDENTPECYRETIEHAISNQAKIVVCVGYDFGESLGIMQYMYPRTSFLLVDSVPMDSEGNAVDMEGNVHCVSFREEESGYLAGYMAVVEGFRNLGFIGGEEDPSVLRYGYGYLQGIDDAAADMELTDVTVNYWYADTYLPNQEIIDEASRWYSEGTEIIFACGGSLYESVLEAAEQENGLLIGVDVDQSELSERFVTSAIKDLSNAVIISLDDYYATGGKWSGEFAGRESLYGARDDCVGIPVMNTEWRFKQATKDDYYKVLRRVKFGEVDVSDEIAVPPEVSLGVNYE